MINRDPASDDVPDNDDTIVVNIGPTGTVPTAGHRHFHDALHPGGLQGVKTTADTEGSLVSQSGPQPSGGRTGMTEHVGGEDRSGENSVTDELSNVEIGHFGENKPNPNGPQPSGTAPPGPAPELQALSCAQKRP